MKENWEKNIEECFEFKEYIRNNNKLDPISDKIIKINRKFKKINKAIGSMLMIKKEKKVTKLISKILRNDKDVILKRKTYFLRFTVTPGTVTSGIGSAAFGGTTVAGPLESTACGVTVLLVPAPSSPCLEVEF